MDLRQQGESEHPHQLGLTESSDQVTTVKAFEQKSFVGRSRQQLFSLLKGICGDDRADGLARELIGCFGGIGPVLVARDEQLRAVAGMTEDVIRQLRATHGASCCALREELAERPIMGSWSSLVDYLQAKLAYRTCEQAYGLFLDRANHLIKDEQLSSGTVDHTPLYVRDIVRRLLELDASALILVHNHPTGKVKPSRTDIQSTRNLATVLGKIGAELHDHVIVGRGNTYSFRNNGIL